MTKVSSLVRHTIGVIIIAVALFITPSSASGSGSTDIIQQGSCTKSSSYKLKLSEDDAGVEVEFEVDQNKNGVQWTVQFYRNNAQFASQKYKTQPPSGSFDAKKVNSNKDGTFKVVATSPGGETCSASATASF
jgi:hypothetical protein